MDDLAFLRRVARSLRCDERRAEGLTFVVFQALRDRLTPNEAGDVAAQLPTRLKHLWQDGDRPDRQVERTRKLEFLGRVRQSSGLPDMAEAERAVTAVFSALQTLLGSPTGREGEAWDVFSQLPKDLKALWLAAGERDAKMP
jgi:uncharacterized protein (DUF2267 family)